MPRVFALIRLRLRRAVELTRLVFMAWRVGAAARPESQAGPVLFFNASTRLSGLSQNAGFSLLASWMVRLAGVRVVHFACRAGMSRCVLGTDENDPGRPMPCGMCIRQSRLNLVGAEVRWFGFEGDDALGHLLQGKSLDELLRYEHPLPDGSGLLPLGRIVLPSLRWRLRLNTLVDADPTRALCREFMLSAWNIASRLLPLLEELEPRAAVVFNGIQFPEATVAWLCRRGGVPVVTHEAGFQPLSGYFFSEPDVTYPIVLPEAGLTPAQEAILEADLQRRWQGDFSMAGVKFWQEMHGLPEDLVRQAAGFRQVVPVFTNVIFDTSQQYANVVYPDMFAWLDELAEVACSHPQALFILRAHPDESRPGKASRESVAMWFEQNASHLPNLAFIPPRQAVSSYDLVKRADFVLVYNSNIGLESILLGVPALAAAAAPFTAFDTVFFEHSREEYRERLSSWLAGEVPPVGADRLRNTRRFLYHRYYRCSLPFREFLQDTQPLGYVRLKRFPLSRLAGSASSRALLRGLLQGKRFELDD